MYDYIYYTLKYIIINWISIVLNINFYIKFKIEMC